MKALITACRSLILLTLTAFPASGTTYYVAKHGSDTNSGLTLSDPFETISSAAAVMVAGDTCFIREGIYREILTPANSGSADNPITFLPYNGEKVTISGADIVSGWSVYSGHIYRADMGWDLGDGFNQVFVDGTMVNRARWPNTGSDLLSPTLASGSATSDQISLPVTRPADYWVGGTVYGLFGHKWTSQGGTITASTTDGILAVSDKTRHWFTGSGSAYITGILEELDTEGEWFIQDGKLYLWADGSVDPSGLLVEAKARKWCVNLSGKSYIHINSIDMFAGTISLNGANNCQISGSRVKYQSHFTKYTWSGMDAGGNRAWA